MQVKTTLNAMSEAYIILDELGLAGMLAGAEFEIKPGELVTALLKGRKVQEFISAITDLDEQAAGELSIAEAIEVVTRFFASIGSELSMLPGIVSQVKPVASPV